LAWVSHRVDNPFQLYADKSVVQGVNVMIAFFSDFRRFSPIFADFRRFSPIFADFRRKNGVLFENECYDPFFCLDCSHLSDNHHFFSICLQNNFYITTSVPGTNVMILKRKKAQHESIYIYM
jgi:hypothetical protein